MGKEEIEIRKNELELLKQVKLNDILIYLQERTEYLNGLKENV